MTFYGRVEVKQENLLPFLIVRKFIKKVEKSMRFLKAYESFFKALKKLFVI